MLSLKVTRSSGGMPWDDQVRVDRVRPGARAGAWPAARRACRSRRSPPSAPACRAVPCTGSCGRRAPRSANPAAACSTARPGCRCRRGPPASATDDGGRKPTVHAGGSPMVRVKSPSGHAGRVVQRRADRLHRADVRRQQHQQLLERGVIGHRDLAHRGEVGQQHRQRRLDLVQQRGRLVGRAGPVLQDGARICGSLVVSCSVMPARLRAQVRIESVEASLAVQQWPAVVDQRAGLVGDPVEVAGQPRRRVQQRAAGRPRLR